MKGIIPLNLEYQPLSSLLVVLCLLAGSATGSARVIDTSPPGPRELVWRVKSDTSVLFLMGSIHALSPADYPLPARLQRTFQLADQYVFEVDLDEAGALVQEFVSSRGLYSNGGSIRSVLAPGAYQKLQNLAVANNLTPTALDPYRPWVVSSVVENYLMQQAGLKPEWGVDQTFFNQAKIISKPRFYLETARSQLETLTAVPEAEYTRTIAEKLDLGAAGLMEVVNAWKSKDLPKLTEIVESQRLASSEQYRLVIRERNTNFTARAEAFLKEPRWTLMIVGVAHLVGRDGVVQALRDRGHYVVQIPASPPVAEPLTLAYKPVPERTMLFDGATTPTLVEGGSFILQGGGSGDGPFTYQWHKDGEPVAGGATNRLARGFIQPSDSGAYSLRIDSEFGSTFSTPFVVSVVPPAPPQLSIRRNRGSILTLTLSGTTNATYQIEQAAHVLGPWLALTNVTLNFPDQGVLASGTNQTRFFRTAY